MIKNMKSNKYKIICFVLFFVLALSLTAFAGGNSELKKSLKEAIYNTYGIKVYDQDTSYGYEWSELYLKSMIEVFKDLPPSFVQCTKAVIMDSSNELFEIKYNGYNEEFGMIQVGYGAFSAPVVYLNQFKKVYNSSPSHADYVNRFKSMLVRGMTYSFISENTDGYGRSELMQAYQSVYASNASFSTKIYSIGDENFMVVAPGKNFLWVDLAFAVQRYCTDAAGLKSKYPERYEFVKKYIFDEETVDGWTDKYLDGTGQTSGGDGHSGDYVEPDFGTDTSIDTNTIGDTDTNTNTGTATNTDPGTDTGDDPGTDTETDPDNIPVVNDRDDIPAVPEGDYLPIVSQLNTGGESLEESKRSMPEGMKTAIKELLAELPKSFTTCTVGINYMPTTDTCDAFSSEGYVFVTNNSWYAPSSFAKLDEATQAKRFKEILVREMTKCYLYYHGSLITRWRGAMGKEITNEGAKTDIVESAVLYYEDPAYLESLKALKWSFIKTNIFTDKPVTPTGTDTNTGTETGTDTGKPIIKLTIKNATSSTITIGRQADGKDVSLIIYGSVGDYTGYIRLSGKFDGNHTISAGSSVTGNCTIIDETDKRFNNYPFATKDQYTVGGGYKANNAIYMPDGSSYKCEPDLTGKFVYGNSYTITYNGGPDNAGAETDTNTGTNTSTNTGTNTSTNTGTNTDTGEEPYDGDLTVKVTIKNATSSTLTIGRSSDNMAVGFQIYGDYKDGSGGRGYIRLKGYFSGSHTIAAGGSSTGILSFEEKTYGKFNGYPFCTAEQVKGGVPSNAAIYKPDGASYCCEEMLTGKFLNGAHYTITFKNGPVVP
jgi:hypothetical protein